MSRGDELVGIAMWLIGFCHGIHEAEDPAQAPTEAGNRRAASRTFRRSVSSKLGLTKSYYELQRILQ
jgi:hypothetical protein